MLAATTFEWAQLAAAAFAVVAAIGVPASAYFRRPSVELVEDGERTYSRLEGVDDDVPVMRLLVRAGRVRRAAHGARVEVVGVRRQDETTLAPLGHWPLGRTSAEPAAVTVYAGAEGAADFAVLEQWHPDDDVPIVDLYAEAPSRQWHLRLGLHGPVEPADPRHRLEPGAWVVRLVVGSDDGSARTYDVHVSWQGDEPDAKSALAAVLEHLAVVDA